MHTVSSGRAKIHVNGRVTKSFELGRGVRQGCPVSPLLFVISTQPLMRLLRVAKQEGSLKGVHVPRGRPLLRRLFADDSRVAIAADDTNFRNLCKVIDKFERASGAQLNLAKSVIIPMAITRIPSWLETSGCKVLKEGESVVYLGCKAGVKMPEDTLLKDLTEKCNGRLTHWANRFLSWPSKITLLKHVLRSIPTNQFLGLGLSRKGYKQLESVCRDFMWEQNSEGKTRKPLVAWDSVAKPFEEGGLDVKPFQVVADALKLKYIGRLLEGEDEDWSYMIKYFIRGAMQNTTHGRESRWWTPEEGLLLLNTIPVPQSDTARQFIQSWIKVCRSLTLDPMHWSIPQTTTVRQAELLIKYYWEGRQFNTRIIWPILKKMRVTKLLDIAKPGGGWTNILEEIATRDESLSTVQEIEVEGFQEWLTRMAPALEQESQPTEQALAMADPAKRLLHWIKATLLQTIDEALINKQKGGTLTVIVAAVCQQIWADRNAQVFRNLHSQIPTRVILLRAFQEIDATLTPGGTQKQWDKKVKQLAEIRSMLNSASPGLEHQSQEPSDLNTILTMGIASLAISSDPNRDPLAPLPAPIETLVGDPTLTQRNPERGSQLNEDLRR
ncbi:hypothetical protein R1sor_006773 [Riccia sorocarpa]|uniref:Reverse transcriptase domain-containing protein n=1 Tax=Riccia sorocarpa TaxID=122646 RepID=A0ABD3HNH3_9MARC